MNWSRFSVRLGSVILVLSFAGLLSWAQPDTANLQEQGRSTLTSAWSAMGGSQAWSTVLDSKVTGTCQDLAPDGQPQLSPEPFTWTTSGHEFRYENGASDDLKVMVSGHGKPQMFLPHESQTLTYETAPLERPFYLPALVLEQELNDQNYRVDLIGRDLADGAELLHVRIQHFLLHTPDAGSDQDWWLDPVSLLPRKITFRLPGQAVQSYFDVTYTFTAWDSEAGMLFPSQFLISAPDAGISQTCSVSQLRFNTQPADSLFEAR